MSENKTQNNIWSEKDINDILKEVAAKEKDFQEVKAAEEKETATLFWQQLQKNKSSH